MCDNNIARDANDDVIKKAYRKMAVQFHPDKMQTSGDQNKERQQYYETKFAKINEGKPF